LDVTELDQQPTPVAADYFKVNPFFGFKELGCALPVDVQVTPSVELGFVCAVPAI
jgi:hypothetical protein